MGDSLQLPLWREYYNPLRGLTIARIVAMEDAADRGQYADLQWLWRHMEPADVTVSAAIARRLAFLDTLSWQIRATEGADPALAAEQTQFLTDAYNRIENLADATRFLALSIFRGFSHLEKVPADDDPRLTRRLEPIEQVFWIRPHNGPWQFNPETRSELQQGEPVDMDALVVHEAPPANRGIARHFFAKTLAAADWDADLAAGAVPNIFVIGPPGTSEEKAREYAAMAQQMASNGRGYLPNGAQVLRFDSAAGRGELPHVKRIQYCDEQIVLAATGGKLTMLTAPGSGTLAGGAHSDTLADLAKSDAARLTETYQTAFDKPLLAQFFPGQPQAAYFSFDIPNEMNAEGLLAAVGNLSWAGLTVEPAQLAEKTGLRLIPLPQKPGA